MPHLNTTAGHLRDELQVLRQRWQGTALLWNDQVRWYFEEYHWEPLEKQTEATLHEMERLAEVIARARRSVR